MHCFLWTLILANQFGGIWEKQNRLNSSFVLSMWLGRHHFDPGQNSLWINHLALVWAAGHATRSRKARSTAEPISRPISLSLSEIQRVA